MIGEHILLHFSHFEGFVDNFNHLEGFVDNITDIWINPLGVVFNICLKSGGSEGVAWRVDCRVSAAAPARSERKQSELS